MKISNNIGIKQYSFLSSDMKKGIKFAHQRSELMQDTFQLSTKANNADSSNPTQNLKQKSFLSYASPAFQGDKTISSLAKKMENIDISKDIKDDIIGKIKNSEFCQILEDPLYKSNYKKEIAIVDKFLSDENLYKNENLQKIILKSYYPCEIEEVKLDLIDKYISDEKLYNNENIQKIIPEILDSFYSNDSEDDRKAKHRAAYKFLSDEKLYENKGLQEKIVDIIKKHPYSSELMDKYISEEKLYNNENMQEKIGDILCSNDGYEELELMNKYLSDKKLYNNKELQEKIGDIIKSCHYVYEPNNKCSVMRTYVHNEKLYNNKNIQKIIGDIVSSVHSSYQCDVAWKFLSDEKLYNNENLQEKIVDIINDLARYREEKIENEKAKEKIDLMDKYISDEKLYNNENLQKIIGELVSAVKIKEGRPVIDKYLSDEKLYNNKSLNENISDILRRCNYYSDHEVEYDYHGEYFRTIYDYRGNSDENAEIIVDLMDKYGSDEKLYNNEILQENIGDIISNIDNLESAKAKINMMANENVYEQGITNELSGKEEENSALITSIYNLEVENLKDFVIGDTSLSDFWLNLENSEIDKNRIKNNDRLKNIWFNETIKDQEKVKNLISITLDKLQSENELIKTARETYKDIIENDTTITDNQKEILVKQQESLLFFKVISNKLNADDILKMEVNILDTLEQLENEKSSIEENAINNIFTPVRNSAVLTSENAEDIENSEYIISLAKEAVQNSTIHREILSIALDKVSKAKLSGNNLLLEKSWNKIADIAQKYFETCVLDNITNRNIELLNSINEKVSDDDSKKIKDLTKDKNLSIEQREFIARYKDDKNFKILLNNQNIDIKAVIEDLVFFESSNKALLEENNIDEEPINFAQIISDKFKQINNENKDIKIQTDRVIDKLGEIETTISDFSGYFDSFANDMLDIEINQLQQIATGNDYLYAISNNTKEINEYTQALTRAKLVELGKDKYYKDIIPEITNLLPDDEQFNLKDFMQKVETLAKQEKDAKRKNTIIKVGVAVGGASAVIAGVYYFGPQIVAHLASKLPVAQAGLAANEAIKTTNVAKRIGNSQLVGFGYGRSVAAIQADIKRYEGIINSLNEQIIKHPDDGLLGVKLENAQKRLSELYRELSKAISK